MEDIKEKKSMKSFNIRLEKQSWFFLKMYCAKKETNMNQVLNDYVEKLKSKYEKDHLTSRDANV